MDKEITLDEAQKVIGEYPNEDSFICDNIQMSTGSDGEYNDNSIWLSDYYRKCIEIVRENLHHKHG